MELTVLTAASAMIEPYIGFAITRSECAFDLPRSATGAAATAVPAHSYAYLGGGDGRSGN